MIVYTESHLFLLNVLFSTKDCNIKLFKISSIPTSGHLSHEDDQGGTSLVGTDLQTLFS